MITLIATVALLSCGEAQRLIDRVDPEQFTRREYKDVVNVIRENAPARCKLTDKRHRTRRRFYKHKHPIYVKRPYYCHPGYRDGWQRPVLTFYGPEPSLLFRF